MKLFERGRFMNIRWLAAGFCALTALGCGGGAGRETVKGTVLLDGAPLAECYLTLAPKNAEIKGPFVGKTDAQGHFTLGPIDDPDGGAPPGEYQLAMTTSHSDGMETSVPTPERVPANARVRDLEVPEGGLPDLKLDLSSAKK
jgi:hypothetical protein